MQNTPIGSLFEEINDVMIEQFPDDPACCMDDNHEQGPTDIPTMSDHKCAFMGCLYIANHLPLPHLPSSVMMAL